MIRARILSTTMSAKPDAPIEMNMEMYVADDTGFLSCPNTVFIMTENEYEAEAAKKESLRKRLNEKEGEICKLIVGNDVEQSRLREKIKQLEEENKALDSVSDVLSKSLLDEREKTRKLEETIKRLKERLAQDVAEVDIHPDGTFVFKKKRVSELEKEVEKLKEENKALKEDKFTMKITGGLFYKED